MAEARRDHPIVVVGAGLAGCMTALLLARRNDGGRPHQIRLFEKRSDFREDMERENDVSQTLGASTDTLKRSINLALSHRGQCALRAVGLEEEVMAHTVPMPTRAIHAHDGRITLQPYGTHGECIYSISRIFLNQLLLDRLEELPNVELHFNHKIMEVSRTNEVVLRNLTDDSVKRVPARLVIGTDGAYSGVRSALLRNSRTDFSRHYIEHGYKELTMEADVKTGDYHMSNPNALHIWPRKEFMLIALPNPDKSFTCTLFAPDRKFNELDEADDLTVQAFFDEEFPDAAARIPDIVHQYRTHPTGALVTIRVNPWNRGDRMLILGDAAHAVVPFFGQGMNAAFEDALVLDEVITECEGDLSEAVPKFAERRRPDGDAIGDLSLANYVEMRSHTASFLFLQRKRLEAWLHTLFPSTWIPLYSMVAFTRVPYHEAIERAEWQDRVLTRAGWTALALAVGGAAAYAWSRHGPTIRISWDKARQ